MTIIGAVVLEDNYFVSASDPTTTDFYFFVSVECLDDYNDGRLLEQYAISSDEALCVNELYFCLGPSVEQDILKAALQKALESDLTSEFKCKNAFL